MPGTAVGLFMIDFIARPFARILEKWPIFMILFLLVLYGIIGWTVIRSAFMTSDHSAF